MNLAQVKLESTEMLVDLTGKEDEDAVRSLLVLGSPPALKPAVWSPPSNTLTSMSGLNQLTREWIDLEKDLSKSETGQHMPTGLY